MRAVLLLMGVLAACAVPLGEKAALALEGGSLTVFDGKQTEQLDNSKHYVLYLFDEPSCKGAKSSSCSSLEGALVDSIGLTETDDKFAKYKGSVVFGKVNKDDFPAHKKEFEKAKLSLPIILFWPAGHIKPTCRFESAKPSADTISEWLAKKLKDEDGSLLQVHAPPQTDEPAPAQLTAPAAVAPAVEAKPETPVPAVEAKLDTPAPVEATPSTPTEVDPATLVCKAGEKTAEGADVSCSDLMAPSTPQQGLVQLEKTEKMWDPRIGDTRFVGPADNSLPHELTDQKSVGVPDIDLASFQERTKKNHWQALFFHSPNCKYCDCLPPVWQGVANNLVASERQPNLEMASVNGDDNAELRNLFDVNVYPTFLLVNRDGTKVLGRYLGPRKVFDLSNWIEDLIVADEAPVTKYHFEKSEEGDHVDMHPVFPYSGDSAYPPKA